MVGEVGGWPTRLGQRVRATHSDGSSKRESISATVREKLTCLTTLRPPQLQICTEGNKPLPLGASNPGALLSLLLWAEPTLRPTMSAKDEMTPARSRAPREVSASAASSRPGWEEYMATSQHT